MSRLVSLRGSNFDAYFYARWVNIRCNLTNIVESFNFATLVAQFDADIAANATNATNWQLTDVRLTAHLQSGSDSEAIGGDLTYQYGRNNNLTGMGLNHAQGIMGNASFGQMAQAINDPNVWQTERVKLG